MKATLEHEFKKVRFMEPVGGTTHLHSKGLTYTDICDVGITQYQEFIGVGKWPPVTHAKDSKVPPSSFTQAKVHVLVQFFQKGQPTSWLQTRAMTLATFVVRNIGLMNVQTRLALQQSLAPKLQAQQTFLGTFKMSWMWKFMQQLQTLP